MADDLAKLNRLRVNAGKTELKSWKASQSKLKEAITKLQEEGHTDALPGANIDATPQTDDPEVLAKLMEKKETEETSEETTEKTVTKVKSALARGADNGAFTEHSRKSVQDQRIKERAEEKAKRKEVKLSKGDKKQIKDEAEDREYSKKKDRDDKAERQKKHIEEKRAKRAAEGKLKPPKEKDPNEVTVADIARDLGIEPKIARAKLRRHEDKLEKLHTKGQDRWTFPKSARKDIEKILKGSK